MLDHDGSDAGVGEDDLLAGPGGGSALAFLHAHQVADVSQDSLQVGHDDSVCEVSEGLDSSGQYQRLVDNFEHGFRAHFKIVSLKVSWFH